MSARRVRARACCLHCIVSLTLFLEVDRIITALQSGTDVNHYKYLFAEEEESFGRRVIYRNPDYLKTLKTVDIPQSPRCVGESHEHEY